MGKADGSGTTRRPRVLVLDDEARLVRNLRIALEDEAEVVGVTDADSAIRILRSDEHLDMAFFDIMGVNGHEVAKTCREVRPNLPFAMLSASQDPEDINTAAIANVTFIAKGSMHLVEDLRRVIRANMGRETLADKQVRLVRALCTEKELTKRHEDVLLLRLHRKKTEAIALALGISESTVRGLEQQIRERTGMEIAQLLALLDDRLASS